MAVRHGASFLGLVSSMPSGPGIIPEERIADIAAGLPPHVCSVLLTSKSSSPDVLRQQRTVHCNAIQLVNPLNENGLTLLKQNLPGVKLIQVLHVTGEEALERIPPNNGLLDALLLDSGNPQAKVQRLGGTGQTHNWHISREIRKRTPLPVFLACGLNADNISQAIKTVRPYAVDVCSGVRYAGRLNADKLAAFMNGVKKALI